MITDPSGIDPNIIIALIATIGSVCGIAIGAVLTWYFTKGKANSEIAENEAAAVESISTAAQGLIEPLTEQISKLKTQVGTMQTERETEAVAHLTEMEKVQAQIREMKQELFRKDGQIQELRGGLDVLIGQMKQLGIIARYIPE